jgi:diketogulonate reductase-like aldo/keto reductase
MQTDKRISKRMIPSSGEMLPVIGLGTWEQFDVAENSGERNNLAEVLKIMAEGGGKIIDSSPMYGRSEGMVGDLTTSTHLADRFFYATKVWTSGERQGIAQMEESFRRMKRSTMDLMQVHNFLDWQTHLKTLAKWKEEGKVRYTGVTHYVVSAHDDLERIVRTNKIDFVQFNYSIRIRNAEKSLLKGCSDHGVAVIVNEPLEKGALFKLVKGKTLPEWAVKNDIHSWGQFFLKYILAHPAVTCVIPGTSDPGHMKDLLAAGCGRLPDEKLRKKMVAWMEDL